MKKIDGNEILNLWLMKYHNITVEELVENLPKEVLDNPSWFKLYPCTQEQHDEWVKETKKLLNKKYKMSKYLIDRGWGLIELDCSPYVKI